MSSHAATARRIALVSLLSFGAAFGLVPLYEIACEKVFGIKLETGPAGERRLRPGPNSGSVHCHRAAICCRGAGQ